MHPYNPPNNQNHHQYHNPYHQPLTPPPNYHPPPQHHYNHPNTPNQQYNQPKNNNPHQYPPPNTNNKNKSLMQPPALNVQEQIDLNEQLYHQKPPMTMSNNLHSQFDGYHQAQEQQNWANEAQIASMFWQQRCMTMLQRFEWFYDRFQIIRQEYISLSDQMQKMDSQEQWHHFQEHHNELHEKIEEMEQQLTAVLGQNEQLLQQKHTQDNQSVWEQRYQQLLGNFKSLQEEMANTDQNSGNNGEIVEQYRQLEEHCAELEYQYNEVYNEYQKYRETGVGDLEHQLSSYMQEIENYKGKLNELHGENVQLQNMLVQLEQQNNSLKEERFNSGGEIKKKYEQLLNQVYEKQEQIRSLQQEFKMKSKVSSNATNFEKIIQEKGKEILELQRLIDKKNSQLKDNKNHSLLILEETKTKLKDQHDKEKHSLLKSMKELQKDIEGQKREKSKSSDFTYKIQNLQKKLGYANQEVQNLNENIKKKNEELIELRGLTYEVQKLKDAQSEFGKVVDQKDRLTEYIRKKNQQIELLLTQNQKLTHINQQLNNKRQEFNSRNLREQIQDLSETISHYENEINRQKSLILLKEDYSRKLQEELKQAKEKLVMINQVYEMQSQNWKDKEIKISTKTNDYDQKIKNLDYEFNMQLKDTLERQITVLRKQNTDKQNALRKLQEHQLLLLSKISVFEKQQGHFDKEIELIKEKGKEYQSSLTNNSKKYKELEQIYKIKCEEINSMENRLNAYIANESKLRGQIEQNINHLRIKNKTIEQLDHHLKVNIEKVEEANRLASENSKLHLLVQTLQRENSERLQVSKIKGLSVVHSKSTFVDKQENNNLVNILTQENQILKEEINKIIQRYGEIPQFGSKHQKEIDPNLNKRLNQFNNRLQITIKGASSVLDHSQSQKTVYLWQQERNNLISHYESEIKSLRELLQGKKFGFSQVSNVSNQSGITSNKKMAFNKYESETMKEEIEFLREKTHQYQERNHLLLKLNQQLKSKVQSILHLKQANSTLDYYKQQLQKSQLQYQALTNKYKKVSEQNRQNKLQLTTKHTKLSQEFQFKAIELSMIIQEQQRRISLLQTEKLTTDNEKATLIHNMNVYNINGKAHQKQSAQSFNAYASRNNNYNSKQVVQTVSGVKSHRISDLKHSPKNSANNSKYDHIHNEFGSILNNHHFMSEQPSQSNIKSVQSRLKYSKKI